MNVSDFLNSKSVAKYLQETNYNFSPQEAAFIVWNSSKTLEEKLAAWREIINTMPDCAVRCRFDYPQYSSLRKFLRDHIALISRVGEKADERKLNDDDYYLYTAFEFMWFDIPTPFRKGDIVYSKSKHIESYDIYVLIDIANWKKVDYIKNGYTDDDYRLDKTDESVLSKLANGDYTDMSAHGYRILSDGTIDYDFFCNYIDFEYAAQTKLTGMERALIPLSNYLKGNIDLELYLNAHRIICDEENIGERHARLFVSDEGLHLMGLKK